MPLPPRLFPGDVELGKRDDDHKPGSKSQIGYAWQHRRIPQGISRRSMKRIALGFLVLVALYYFVKNIPTDLKNPRIRPSYGHQGDTNAPYPPSSHGHGSTKNLGSKPAAEAPRHDFNGPIKFYDLASTLHAVTRTGGSDLINKNVLFSAASLKSAAILLPIACEMAARGRNYVHFALMGRDDISMDILKSVNGITKECNILFHDARPDFPSQSSDFRMEVSSSAASNHINNFVHPQATFIDASGEEELWFTKGLADRAIALGQTIIELPNNAEQNLMWITLLDSASLKAWDKVSIDIIVHAQSSSSGALTRLLQSLKMADFFSSGPPHLTIELPHSVDETTRRYLEHFHWPPMATSKSGSQLTLHHRIPQHGLTSDENSIRFLESFWPAKPHTSHVLVLSPQVELSPLFFHYLKYTVLEYMYSTLKGDFRRDLLGISLDLPSTYLNDSTSFVPPRSNSTATLSGITPFLWQAPNSNAMLYFGEKWVELHDFGAQSLVSQHSLPTPTTLHEKLVSKTYPAWLEHVLKLVRARGYMTIYPNFNNEHSLATLHHELYAPPGEFADDIKAEIDEFGELTADPKIHLSSKAKETTLIKTSLLSILPFKGVLPDLDDMPLLAWNGEKTDLSDTVEHAVNFSQVFRREIGGCGKDSVVDTKKDMFAGDLFCLDAAKT